MKAGGSAERQRETRADSKNPSLDPRGSGSPLSTEALRAMARESLARFRFGAVDEDDTSGPIIRSASGSWITDTDGQRYLDFNAGQQCATLGHNHPRVVDAIAAASRLILHAPSSFFNEYSIALASKLHDIAPPPLDRSYFLLSGSDANEAALGMARVAAGRYEVAVPDRGFHGYSDGVRAVSMAGFRRGYPIRPSGVHAIFTPNCYRCPLKMSYPDCGIACLDASFELVDAQLVDGLAAVITEPLFLAAGVVDPPDGWLKKLQSMVHDRGGLLIVDEVVTFAKTGDWWAFRRQEIVPDLVTLGKHLGGGVPIGAVILRADIEELVASLGFLFAHSTSSDPLSSMAACAVIDAIQSEGLLERAMRIGNFVHASLEGMFERHALIGDVRGRGLIQGIELVRDRDTKEPAREEAQVVQRFCFERGLIVNVSGGRGGGVKGTVKGNVVRLVPPLSTSDEELASAMSILDDALAYAGSSSARL